MMKRGMLLGLLALAGVLMACAAGKDEAGYQLAAQDKIAVTVLRHPELSQTYTVPPDGTIDFPRVGEINIIGKTTAELAAAISERLRKILREPEVSVVLVDARRHTAYVLGSVAKPGPYALPAGARITELLAAAGDLTGEREKLTASLIRGEQTLKINLQAAINGDAAANLEVLDGDVMWVQSPVLMTVVVTGQVKTPGSFRLEEGSRLLDLLAKAGDLAGERERLTASLVRNNTPTPLKLQAALTGVDPAANIALRDGDLLIVQAPPVITVMLSGQVRTPGPVKLDQGSRVLDAVAKMGDLVGEREKLSASLIRGTKTLPVRLQAALSGTDREANLVLEDGDTLVIQAPPKITVTVMGQVKNPGMVKLDEGGTLVSVLTLVGDLTERPERVRIKLLRNGAAEAVKYGDNTVTMQDGDVVSVERETMIRVYVNGQVKNPGAFDMLEGGGPLEAIALAGGIASNPSLTQVTIKRHGGEIETVNLASALIEGNITVNPRLNNGDQVLVPESTTKIAVLGGVNRAGIFPVNDAQPITVIEAITLAGGETKKARLNQVVVIRDIDPQTKKAKRINVDVNAILKKGKSEQNIVLQSKDIVFVPESGFDLGNIVDYVYRFGILASVL